MWKDYGPANDGDLYESHNIRALAEVCEVRSVKCEGCSSSVTRECDVVAMQISDP